MADNPFPELPVPEPSTAERSEWPDATRAYVEALEAALDAACKRAWPAEITPEIKEVLGLMIFRTGPIAHIYQAAGLPIAKRAEDEQAFVLHRFLGFALDHGVAWMAAAERDIKAHPPLRPAGERTDGR